MYANEVDVFAFELVTYSNHSFDLVRRVDFELNEMDLLPESVDHTSHW